MSSDTDAVATLFNAITAENYCAAAASALFIYDTIVTFDREVACFWTHKRAAASLLFFANKWIYMTISVLDLVQLRPFPSDKSCSQFQVVGFAFVILQFVPAAVFSALRAYVLGSSKLLGLIVLVLSLAPVGVNLVQYAYEMSGQNFPPFGCLEVDKTTVAIALRRRLISGHRPWRMLIFKNCTVVISSRIPLIVADLLLIYITWTKLSSRSTFDDVRSSKRLSLPGILFRTGTIYFVALFILNVLHLSLTLTSLTGKDRTSVTKVTVFIAPVSAILVSRFLLELQAANQMVVRLDPDDPLHSSRNPYDKPSFISSLGGSISPGLPVLSDDNDSDDNDSETGVEGSETASAPESSSA
ncbi:hypothetical protein OH76DRAFT_1407228 [Lentinus brumalis]|uniref:DUF6533 domain-containing protein n=1 Tax=Lentinus brumalis TaxID=2498619 RepID=A0A371D0M4_9APHY|nr:hypothetical protein OH76DRAFT_1407228 [Polyporus brumalis]